MGPGSHLLVGRPLHPPLIKGPLEIFLYWKKPLRNVMFLLTIVYHKGGKGGLLVQMVMVLLLFSIGFDVLLSRDDISRRRRPSRLLISDKITGQRWFRLFTCRWAERTFSNGGKNTVCGSRVQKRGISFYQGTRPQWLERGVIEDSGTVGRDLNIWRYVTSQFFSWCERGGKK